MPEPEADPTDGGVSGPDRDCGLCPRLAEMRNLCRRQHPDWHAAPVGSFGPIAARVLIVGLAPGLRGANRTGRPFTGDYAGVLLYQTLLGAGLASGAYDARADDGLRLVGCRITNAVRCVPPDNKPSRTEAETCRQFLAAEVARMSNLKAILALGAIAHDAVLGCYGLRRAMFKFGHGARHALPNGIVLADSYHCSRLNTNTGRLTPDMFATVVAALPGAGADGLSGSERAAAI